MDEGNGDVGLVWDHILLLFLSDFLFSLFVNFKSVLSFIVIF